MPTSTNYPPTLAKSIAKLLEADPIASGQVKEHISRERLLELLGIEPEIVTEEVPVQAERVSVAVAHFHEDEIIEFIKNRFTKTQILELVA